MAETESNDPTDSRLYWFFVNTGRGIAEFWQRHRMLAFGIALVLVLLAVVFRALLHPYVLELRKLSFVLILIIPLLGLVWFVLRRRSLKLRVAGVAVVIVLIAALAHWEILGYNYIRLYSRYATLPIAELEQLPETSFERIQPLNSVYSLAHEIMTETEAPLSPDFVRVGDEYRWSLAIEPAYPISRMFSGVKELFNVPGTTPSSSFGRENREAVRFDVGETLLFSRNSRRATIRNFGPSRFWGYEPANVSYVTDDNGKWVQLVSLIRWRGLLFPHPEFGGVQMIRQSEGGIVATLRRWFLGVGEWIRPEEIARHEFLVGQNIVAYQVSRFIANSFRFQGGFLAPLPGYHKGDVRIPDLPIDMNNQPFTAHFEMQPLGGRNALYHYFALEPFDPDKQGLNTSVFVPADGSMPVYVYRHHERSGSLTGVSAISAKVMESRKNYDWSRNRPVEHRPYVKEIQGKRRFFWLTTVVTFKEGTDRDRFIAGTVPDVVLTDAAYNTPVWVDPLAREGWDQDLEETLARLWANP